VKYCECYKAAEELESRRRQGVLVEESQSKRAILKSNLVEINGGE